MSIKNEAKAARRPKGTIIEQVAALPYRLNVEGQFEVMLVTSRKGRRWLPPKGNLMKGLAPHEAAACEAFEEAGVVGVVSGGPIGTYTGRKSRALGLSEPVTVTLYPLQFTRQEADWPEKGQRSLLWLTPENAAHIVKEPVLAQLIRAFGARLRD